jgi:hypothetical protein
VADVNLKVYGKHLRKIELDQIAEILGAELILLKTGEGKHSKEDEVEVEGKD